MDPAKTIYTTVRAEGIPPALSSFIVAQARHETANFTSSVFLNCNNCFGYKAVYGAPRCLKSPEGDYYEDYPSIQDSAKEIAAWIRRRQAEGEFPVSLYSITTTRQYASLLKNSGFYGAPLEEYANRLAFYNTQYKTPQGSSTGFVAVLALSTLMWIKRR